MTTANAQDDPYTAVRGKIPRAASRWMVLALLMAFSFLCLFNRNSIAVAGTEHIMDDYGIDEVRMGSIYTAYLLAYTLCMIPGGWLIDRVGPKHALLAMGIGSALLVALTGAVGMVATAGAALVSFWCVRAALGVVTAPMFPGATRSVSLYLPPEMRALGNAMVTGSAVLGVAFVYHLFGALMDQFGWQQAFLVCGAVTAGLACVWAVVGADRPAGAASAGHHDAHAPIDRLPATLPAAPSTSSAPVAWSDLLRSRSLLLLTGSYASAGYFQYLFFYWIEYYFEKIIHLDIHVSRRYSMFVNLGMVAGMFLGGWLSDRLYRRWGRPGRVAVPVIGMVAGAAVAWLGMFATQPQWIVAWFTLSMGMVGMSEGAFWVTASELGGRRGGSAGAILNTGGNLGGLLAPVVTPLISQRYSDWRVGIGLASLFCLLGASLWFWIDPHERSAHDHVLEGAA